MKRSDEIKFCCNFNLQKLEGVKIIVTVDSLYTSHEFHSWHNYLPQEKNYANFEPRIIYALQKVDDVYYAFANARYNLYLTENENYGQLISEYAETSLKMVRSYFLMNALNFYNFAIDLSWQVMFFYTSDNSLYFLASPDSYDKYSNQCSYETLVNKLKYRKESALLHIANSFYNNSLFRELRELYNYLKHRGTLHFQGLGKQYNNPYMGVSIDEESVTYKIFKKRKVEIRELKSKLINLDVLFYNYFNSILSCIVPSNYMEVTDALEDVYKVSIAVKEFKDEELENYEKLFNEFYCT